MAILTTLSIWTINGVLCEFWTSCLPQLVRLHISQGFAMSKVAIFDFPSLNSLFRMIESHYLHPLHLRRRKFDIWRKGLLNYVSCPSKIA